MISYHPLPPSLFSASRWLEISVLLSLEDFQEFLSQLSSADILSLKNPVREEELFISSRLLEKGYEKALLTLHKEENDFSSWSKLLPCAITKKKEAFFLVKTSSGKVLIQNKEPSLLIKPFYFRYAKEDDTFRKNILGKDNIFWGMQLLFPYVYYDPILKETKQVDPKTNENCKLFLQLRKWIRAKTKIVSFSIGKKVDFRLSLNWKKPFFHGQLEKASIFCKESNEF